MMRLMRMAIRRMVSPYEAPRRDIIVVKVPEPAINGKAIGTTVTADTFFSLLKNSRPSTISKPRIKITIDPPTAKEPTSNPRMARNFSPRNMNRIINAPEIRVAFNSLIFPIFSFRPINIGTEPTISITAKRVKVTVRSLLKSILPGFGKSKKRDFSGQ